MSMKFLLAAAMLLAFTAPAWALTPQVGTYDMEWAILHVPVSSDLPDLLNGTTTIQIEAVSGGACPPTSAFMIQNAPATPTEGTGTTTWCIKSDGTFDGSSNTNGSGTLTQYTNDVFYIEAANRRGNDGIWAVGRRQPPPPPPSAVQVFITQPRNGDTVSGTNWVVLWADGTSGSSNVYTLTIDSTVVGTQNAGSSRGPISMPWNTKAFPNGTHTIKATVKDATGATATASISVLVNN